MKTLQQFFTASGSATDSEKKKEPTPFVKRNVSNLSELLRHTKLDAEYEANFVEYNLRRRARSDNCLIPTVQQTNKVNRRAFSENHLKDNDVTSTCENCFQSYYIMTSKAPYTKRFCTKDCYSNYSIQEDNQGSFGSNM